MIQKLLAALVAFVPAKTLRRIGAWQWTGPLARRLVHKGSAWLRRQDVTISHGIGVGLRFNAGGANPGYALGTSEPLVQDTLKDLVKSGMVVYDIGANVGFFTVLLGRLVGARGAVYAFEPVAETAKATRHNAELNGFAHVTVIAAAVGRQQGTVKLALREESTWAKFADEKSTGPTMEVPLVAIDGLVDDGTIKPPQLIKIDVEGAELEVIEGMRRTLAAHRPIILCEMHGKNEAFAKLMEELNYEVRAVETNEPLAGARWDVHALATPRT